MVSELISGTNSQGTSAGESFVIFFTVKRRGLTLGTVGVLRVLWAAGHRAKWPGSRAHLCLVLILLLPFAARRVKLGKCETTDSGSGHTVGAHKLRGLLVLV